MATEIITADIEVLEDLNLAYENSFYAIVGCGGDLNEWVNGYEGLLEVGNIGKPKRWYRVTGDAVNAFAAERAEGSIAYRDTFQSDLTILLFPLEGLSAMRLALFKLQNGDRWFDDIIDNMVRS